ncbi:PTS-dependent dihydroxyacetone kinase phosphotransferase subunit DhaM [Salibacterium salarium]|uniref:phosphoenolpyruvate--glycerone phosphotransferase n=1 Tax=Salibacterium salarium TaxID=284579 RepID=A0A428MW45_9BACI|nr:dihydroxyacetone kinase phosphoryl donor subunit DhaM [Salibacterium salarium]RSL30296.1 PTS-dependent dihydroxyacetone kinase phosphotransferase subunit DhaM [Salibacterium salarium]
MPKVNVVVISHSDKIVAGIVDLISQVKQPDVHIFPAGGTDDGGIGTSVEKITSAIYQAHTEAGVLLLYDLGSASMNAEVAMEMYPDSLLEMADAPIVEGAYVAAVESGLGRTLREVKEAVESTNRMNQSE